MFFDFPVFLVVQTHCYFQRCFKVSVSFFAFLDRIFDFIPAEPEINKFKAQLSGIVFYRRNIRKNLP